MALDFNLLNTNIPAEAASSAMKGMSQVNALTTQRLQNQAANMEIQNALAEQEAYKNSATPQEAQQNLMRAGFGKSALAIGKNLAEVDKTRAETGRIGAELTEKNMNIMRERTKDILQNPSNENYIAHMQEGVRDGLVTPEQARRAVQIYTAIPPNQRVAYLQQGLAKQEDIYKNNTISKTDQARLDQAARFHADTQNRPQYMQTDAGLVALPNVLAKGQAPSGVLVTGPNGENLGRPLKDIPAVASRAIIENESALNKVKRAIDLNEGKEITLPSGDKIQGSETATGFFKGLTPQVILNDWDPKGVDTRAFIADIGSLKIHDRSGAAVTASETPRLKPFIPSISDSKETAAKKLIQFKAEYEDMQNSFAEMYSREQGYRPNPLLTGGGNKGGAKPSLDSIFNPKQ